MSMDLKNITNQAVEAISILLTSRNPQPGEILIVGCSTSEVCGQRIGSASNEQVAVAIMDGIYPAAAEAGLYLAVQGCEHINRALCVPRACMEKYGLQEVWVRPWLHAGGAFSTEATKRIPDHVMVEDLRAWPPWG